MNTVSDWLPVHIDTGVLRKMTMEDFLHRLPTVSEDIDVIMSQVDTSQSDYFPKLNQRLSVVELKGDTSDLAIVDALPMYDAEGIVEKLFIKVRYTELYTAEMVGLLDFSIRSLRNKDSHVYIVTVDHRARNRPTEAATVAVTTPSTFTPISLKDGSDD
jgi:hypothetical protein